MIEDVDSIDWGGELSSYDYALYRADGDHRSRTTIMTIDTLDTTPDWPRLRREVDRASRLVPRLRQKVVAPLLPVTSARWVVDPDFDLDYHMRRVRLPEPGGLRELLDLAEADFLAPLDPGRPLWAMTMVEGLNEDAAAAIVWRFSHTLANATGGGLLDLVLRHDERDPDLGPMPHRPAPDEVSPVVMTRRAVHRLPFTLAGAALAGSRRLLGAAQDVAADRSSVRRSIDTAVGAIGDLLSSGTAGPSPLLARRSTHRRFEALQIPLDDLRIPANAHECSVNDAYIAGICAALRLYHEAKGLPIEELPLAIPVSRGTGEAPEVVAHKWSATTIAAPVAVTDPVERMRIIHAEIVRGHEGSTLEAERLLAPLMAWIPNPVLAGTAGASPSVDVQVSNVPGHPGPRFVAGAQIVRSIPFGPLNGAAMMIVMRATDGICNVGVNYDTAAINDPAAFLRFLQAGFEEVTSIRLESAAAEESPGENPSTL